MSIINYFLKNIYCVQIRRDGSPNPEFIWSAISRIWTEKGPEKLRIWTILRSNYEIGTYVSEHGNANAFRQFNPIQLKMLKKKYQLENKAN